MRSTHQPLRFAPSWVLVLFVGASCALGPDPPRAGAPPTGFLKVTPAGGAQFLARGPEGGPFEPDSDCLVLANTGGRGLSWWASTSTAWARLDDLSGYLAPGASKALTISVGAAVNELRPGVHTGQLVVENLSGPGGASLEVSVVVSRSDPSGPAAPATAKRVERHGIAWTFDRAYPTGRFATDDPWVIGPVAVVAIDPPSVPGDRVRNGSMLDPRGGERFHGYDSAVDGYTDRLNVALGVGPAQPLAVAPGSSLVSTRSVAEAGAVPQLQTAAVLTVLATVPPDGALRPPYCGSGKTVRFREADLDSSLLARLRPVGDTPALAEVAAAFEKPWIDHVPGWSARLLHPADCMPDYGREIAALVGRAAILLHMDFPDAEKRDLLVRFVQLGIDLHGVVESGGQRNWYPDGGHASGRKWPILFAGMVLDDPDMRSIGHRDVLFGEDGQTFYVDEVAVARGSGYTASHLGMPEWGIRHSTHPELDDASWSASYRQCCTANAWPGFVLAARVMEAQALWNHGALFDYLDRYRRIEPPGYQRDWDPWVGMVWDAYRSRF